MNFRLVLMLTLILGMGKLWAQLRPSYPLPYSENFETEPSFWEASPLSDWTLTHHDFETEPRLRAYSGRGFIRFQGSASEETSPGLSPFLISPDIRREADHNPVLYLSYRSQDSGATILSFEWSIDQGKTWSDAGSPMVRGTFRSWTKLQIPLEIPLKAELFRVRIGLTSQTSKHVTLDLDGVHVKTLKSLPPGAMLGYRVSDLLTNPEGPIWFSKSSPGIINLIQNQTGQDFVCAGTWMANQWFAATFTNQELINIDTATGFRQLIGPLSVRINGLAYDPTTHKLFGVGGPANSPNPGNLYEVDTANAQLTLVGSNFGIGLINLACSPGGQLYAADNGSLISSDNLYLLNKTTGAASLMGPVGANLTGAQGMEFSLEDSICHMAVFELDFFTFSLGGSLRTVDTLFGSTTSIGNFQSLAQVAGLAIPTNTPVAAPQASIQSFKDSLCEGEGITFQSSSSGSIDSLRWLLPGGSPATSTSPSPSIQYDVPGTYSVQLLVFGPGGSDTLIISPGVTIIGLPSPLLIGDSLTCSNATSYLLSTVPPGGSLSGPGVIDSTFHPGLGNLGLNQLIYEVENTLGCKSRDTLEIWVQDPVPYNLDAPDTVCQLDPPILIDTAGVIIGPGCDSSGRFHPDLAGPGTHQIYGSYLDSLGCMSMDSLTITVLASPTLSLPSNDSICMGAGTLLLNQGTPNGGIYSGAGVSGNTFDPLLVGLGLHPVQYTYTAANGCQVSDTMLVRVIEPPVVSWVGLEDICLADGPQALLGGLPQGGSYFGVGVSGSTFDPGLAGPGLHVLGYRYESNGCTDTTYDTVMVWSNPMPAELSLNGDTLISSWSGENQWYRDGMLVIGVTTPWILPDSSGSYTAIAVDSNGCQAAASKAFQITLTLIMHPESHALTVIPNPSRGTFWLSWEGRTDEWVRLTLIDQRGREIYNWNRIKSEQPLRIPAIAEGIYLLRIEQNSSVLFRKLLVEE